MIILRPARQVLMSWSKPKLATERLQELLHDHGAAPHVWITSPRTVADAAVARNNHKYPQYYCVLVQAAAPTRRINVNAALYSRLASSDSGSQQCMCSRTVALYGG